jgi:hypothetical protein
MKKLLSGLALGAGAVACLAAAAYGRTTINHPAVTSIVPTVTVNSSTGTLVTLKTSELAVLPQTTVTVPINGKSTTESGPLLSALLTYAGVQYDSACKNDELRYWVEATNPKGQAVVITAGELDTGFGNRPAILSISENGQFLTSQGPRLVVPNDSGARNLQHVSMITVGRAPVQLADTATPACGTTGTAQAPPPGSLTINGDVKNPTTYTFAQLQAMPQLNQTVSFLSGTTPSTNTETGPSLISLIQAAQPKFLSCDPNDELRFYVEVTSSEDGYASTESYAELDPTLNNTMSLMSLIENGASQASVGPRLTVPGDVKGGRYVSGSAIVTVLRAPTEVTIPSCAGSKK